MKTGSVTTAALLVCTLSACSNVYESSVLHLRYEPPTGVKLIEEVPGPPAVARFSSDVELRSVPSALPPIDEKQLEELLPSALQKAGMPAPSGTVASAKAGSIHLGPVARYEIKDGGNRTLVYLIPMGMRFVVLTMTAPVNEYVKMEGQVERSISSLKPHG